MGEILYTADGTPVSDTNGLPVKVLSSALPSGGATVAKQDAIITALGLLSTEAKLEAVRLLLAGTLTTTLTGSTLAEELTEADAVANVLTFAANIVSIEIYHEEATWQTFTVNGLTITIPAGGWARPIGGTPSDEVTIPAGISCIVRRLT